MFWSNMMSILEVAAVEVFPTRIGVPAPRVPLFSGLGGRRVLTRGQVLQPRVTHQRDDGVAGSEPLRLADRDDHVRSRRCPAEQGFLLGKTASHLHGGGGRYGHDVVGYCAVHCGGTKPGPIPSI